MHVRARQRESDTLTRNIFSISVSVSFRLQYMVVFINTKSIQVYQPLKPSKLQHPAPLNPKEKDGKSIIILSDRINNIQEVD